MKAEQFVFWLQGFIEISLADSDDTLDNGITRSQVDCIRKHLALVFKHEIDPSYGPEAVQKALNQIHNPPPVVLTEEKPYHGVFPPPKDDGPTIYRC